MANPSAPKSLGGRPESTYFRQMDLWVGSVPKQITDGVSAAVASGQTQASFATVTASWIATLEADIRHGNRLLAIAAIEASFDANSTMVATPTAAVVASNLTAGASATAGTGFATASVSPTGTSAQLLWVFGAAAVTIGTVGVTGAGLTWTPLVTFVDGTHRMALFKGTGTPSAGALTITWSLSASSCSWNLTEYTNVDRNTPVLQALSAAGLAPLGVTLPGFGAMSPVVIAMGLEATGTVTGFTPGATLSATGSSNVTANVARISAAFADGPGADSTPSYSVGSATGRVGNELVIGAELNRTLTTPAPYVQSSSAARTSARVPVSLSVGDRIKEIDVAVQHVGTGLVAALLWESPMDGTSSPTMIGAAASASGVTADQIITIPSLSWTVAAGKEYFVEWLSPGTANQRLYGADVVFDRPGP